MTDTLEVALGKLQESVKNLGDRELEHHTTVLAELKDIKDNINPRLNNVEMKMYTKADFTQFYNQYVGENKKITTKINYWNGALSVVIFILTFVVAPYVVYLLTHHQ